MEVKDIRKQISKLVLVLSDYLVKQVKEKGEITKFCSCIDETMEQLNELDGWLIDKKEQSRV